MGRRLIRTFRTIVIAIALTISSLSSRAQEFASLTEWLEQISFLGCDAAMELCDKLLTGADNDTLRAQEAYVIFNYYAYKCPLMGFEAIAVHMADDWFLNKRLEWPDPDSYHMCYTYAEFNRLSLIGMEAPELLLEDMYGMPVQIRDIRCDYKILYFYDEGCSSCALQTPLVADLLKSYEGSGQVAFCPVYIGLNRERWQEYVAAHFAEIGSDHMKVYNLWDPNTESGFHMKYSVLTTPALFLIDEDNRIVGRKLDSEALGTLLEIGESSMKRLYTILEEIFGTLGDATEEDVVAVADALKRKCGDDTSLFKETIYRMFGWLKGQSDYEMLKGAAAIAEKYIAGMPDLWSEEVVRDIEEALERFKLNPLGAKANDVKLTSGKGRRKRLLAGRAPYTVLFFNIADCARCAEWKEQLSSMEEMFRRGRIRMVSVCAGGNIEKWLLQTNNESKKWVYLHDADGQAGLHSAYDIEIVPKLYLLDRKKRIIAKELDPATLESLLQGL